MKKFPTIYKRTSKGQIQLWTIIADNGEYHTEEGIQGGTISINKPHVCERKNVGKANETTAQEQAEIEAEAKFDKKLKTGYATSIADIDSVAFEKPMKGYKWIEYADKVIFPADEQDKLNGIRCQSKKDASRSTGGEIFHSIPHIREELGQIFAIHPKAFIDGEGYNEEWGINKQLNRLVHVMSAVYQPKDLTPELLAESKRDVKLYVFDCYGFNGITPETPWRQRHAALKALLKQFNFKYIVLLDYKTVNTLKELMVEVEKARKAKKEGLIVRWGDCPRKEGKSKYMLKYKFFDDEEFFIVDIEEGNGNWAGCAKTIICKLNKVSPRGDATFRSNIEGDEAWLRELFVNKKKYIGEPATVEFQGYSEYLIPQIPFVRAIRNYEKSKKNK